MDFFTILIGIISAICATAILAYISMATMVGPWIAPAIVLLASTILKFKSKNISTAHNKEKLVIIQTIGSVGGIVATGMGFSLPTLYFLNPELFFYWLSKPLYFFVLISAACLSAGGLGIWLARSFADKFIVKEKLSFPVSQFIYKIICSQNVNGQSKEMLWGLSFSWVLCFFRDGFLRFKGFLPKLFYIAPSFFGSNLVFPLNPMLWAIGYLVGIKIAFPLIIGMLSKYFIVYPLNNHFDYVHFTLFKPLSTVNFIRAFAAGLISSELVLGLLKYPGKIWKKFRDMSGYTYLNKSKNLKKKLKTILNLEFLIVTASSSILLYYLEFGIFSQIVFLLFVFMATYQISYLGGKIGLVTFGRFATFIMIPMMLLFKLNSAQITFICVFFNVCAATASDLLFDYKIGQLCDVKFKKIHKYQWLGLIITSLCIGLFLWLLFTNLKLGSAELFAQRAKSRALLIQSFSFDLTIVFLGFLYGVILKKCKISPTLVFGGFLMPNSLSIGLIIGAVLSYITNKYKDLFPFWSGVFAGESIWVLISILTKI